MDYINPELLILIPVLNIIGKIIKNTKKISDNMIPLILGGIGILLSIPYALVSNVYDTTQKGIVMGLIQGVLIAGMSVYGHQIFKQIKENGKDEN